MTDRAFNPRREIPRFAGVLTQRQRSLIAAWRRCQLRPFWYTKNMPRKPKRGRPRTDPVCSCGCRSKMRKTIERLGEALCLDRSKTTRWILGLGIRLGGSADAAELRRGQGLAGRIAGYHGAQLRATATDRAMKSADDPTAGSRHFARRKMPKAVAKLSLIKWPCKRRAVAGDTAAKPPHQKTATAFGDGSHRLLLI